MAKPLIAEVLAITKEGKKSASGWINGKATVKNLYGGEQVDISYSIGPDDGKGNDISKGYYIKAWPNEKPFGIVHAVKSMKTDSRAIVFGEDFELPEQRSPQVKQDSTSKNKTTTSVFNTAGFDKEPMFHFRGILHVVHNVMKNQFQEKGDFSEEASITYLNKIFALADQYAFHYDPSEKPAPSIPHPSTDNLVDTKDIFNDNDDEDEEDDDLPF